MSAWSKFYESQTSEFCMYLVPVSECCACVQTSVYSFMLTCYYVLSACMEFNSQGHNDVEVGE